MSQSGFDSSTASGTPAEPPDLTDLTEFDGDYAAAKPPDNGEVPDGKYGVRVQSVTLGRSQKGDAMLTYDLVVMTGPYARRHIFKNAVITKASLPLVKGDLKTLGLVLRRFSELPNHLDELVGRTLEVTKRTKDEYTNVYFNKRIQVPAQEAGRSKDVPF
jgi:hypothetical protein